MGLAVWALVYPPCDYAGFLRIKWCKCASLQLFCVYMLMDGRMGKYPHYKQIHFIYHYSVCALIQKNEHLSGWICHQQGKK